jgi:uncharacterized protein YuzE
MAEQKFELESSIDPNSGRTVAVYLRVRNAKVAETKEISEGIAYADYDSEGSLLGIELLGPCQIEVLDRLARGEPEAIRRFLHGSVPRELVPT